MPQIIFQDTYKIPIMCYQECARTVRSAPTLVGLNLSDEAELHVDAIPSEEDDYQLIQVMITSEKEKVVDEVRHKQFRKHFADQFAAVGYGEAQPDSLPPNQKNGLNILINILSIIVIISLNLIFPASITLTITLSSVTVLSSLFTARHYLVRFYTNLKNKKFESMPITISLGVLLSAGHTIYHSVIMPLASSFPMLFMSFIMPLVLITLINGMDVIKRLITNKSQKMRSGGIQTLIPEMRKEYQVYSLKNKKHMLQLREEKEYKKWYDTVTTASEDAKSEPVKKSLLQKGMLVKVKEGDCFPVDGFIIHGRTIVDASIHSGEQRQRKHALNIDDVPNLSEDPKLLKNRPYFVPSGAINLDQDVVIYAEEDSYNSTLNQVLYSANIGQKTEEVSYKTFNILYTGLIILGLIAAVSVPLALGMLTTSMTLDNIISIVFTVCPCTIALMLELPDRLSIYQTSNQGIILRKEGSQRNAERIHTVVFDKTGTLTTGDSLVKDTKGISRALLEKVYLLENEFGGSHPIAKAIIDFYEQYFDDPMIPVVEGGRDLRHIGLSGNVQGCDIHVGNKKYIQSCLGVKKLEICPEIQNSINKNMALGYTPIYVAEDKKFCGVIFIEHQIRDSLTESMLRLLLDDVDLIMLTGDNKKSAQIFNKQITALAKRNHPELYEKLVEKRKAEQKHQPIQEEVFIFKPVNIQAGKEPLEKQTFLKELLDKKEAKGLWCIGDGFNDTPFLSFIASKGGTSCSITAKEKAAFFSQIVLNGRLDYLFKFKEMSQFVKKIVLQNQLVITCSTLVFLAIIISFSSIGIAVAPLIPLGIMAFSTGCTLFNSYRMKLAVDVALEKKTSWLKRIVASDLSLLLLFAGGVFLTAALLICTLSTGVITLPAISFTVNVFYSSCSFCIMSCVGSWSLFGLLAIMHLVQDQFCALPLENNNFKAKLCPSFEEVRSLKSMEMNVDRSKKRLDFRHSLSLGELKTPILDEAKQNVGFTR